MLPRSYEVRDWTQDNADYFRAIRIEKTMMSLILLLIVAVAAFNIVAMLVMVVTDKRTDIAIVRTLGASPRRVMGVFLTQGLVIGWLGVALGVVLGLLLAFNVETIVPFLERTFRFQIMDADVYYSTAIPSEVQAWQRGGDRRSRRWCSPRSPPSIRRCAPRASRPPKRCATSDARALRMADRHALPALDAPARLRVVRGADVGHAG